MSLPAAPMLDTAVKAMLGALTTYLPASGGALPDPTISVTSLTERSVGLGNFRGTDVRGAYPAVDLKGIRVDAVTRFQLWAQQPGQADLLLNTLTVQLAGDGEALWKKGFLKVALESAPPPEPIPSLSAWRKHADYRMLYEYTYSDTGGADSLIAKIPIAIDSDFNETTTVTDELVRWDDVEASALVVRGPMTVAELSLLLFAPNPGTPPSGQVVLTRTFDDAATPPVTQPNLAAFLGAVTGPAPSRNATVALSFNAFIPAPAPDDGDPIVMGDRNNDLIPDEYDPRRLVLGTGIALPEITDRFEVAYDALPATFGAAVMYVRATRAE